MAGRPQSAAVLRVRLVNTTGHRRTGRSRTAAWHGHPGRGGRLPFAAAAYILFVLTVGTNMPTPLYPRYQAEFGFSPLVVTLVFAVYAGTLVPTAMLAGALTDGIGYRRVAGPAIGLAAVAALLFCLADGVAWLFTARALQGVSVGAASGALTVALVETEPSGDHARASLLASAMITGGGGIGPVLAGFLGQHAPLPLRLTYLVELALLAVAAAAATRLPRRTRPGLWRFHRPRIPAPLRRRFALASTVSVLGWAVVALFLAMVPSYATAILHRHDLLLAGTAGGMFLLFAAGTQYALARAGTAARPTSGLLLLTAGLVMLAAAGGTRSLWLLLAAAACGGAGQGITFRASLARVNELAPQESRAEVLSAFYMITYLGVGLPVIGVGFLAAATDLLTAVVTFSAVTAPACLLVAAKARTTWADTV
ncbi:MFS transporter [Streptomyces sp. NPDC015345]|uniref:MFS transporter n=1 Tax=Streptomyces sp. NPDC015345 TaxID=3364953 RepID=UPI0037015AC9